MKFRSLTLGSALLVGGVLIGAATQYSASAGVSSGERNVLVPIEPCRLADTRPAPNTAGPRSAPLGSGDTHSIRAQQPGVACAGRIPADATALSLNITALQASNTSFLTVWGGGDRPLAASLNPAPGSPPTPNAVTTTLDPEQKFLVYNDAGNVHIVVDVNGYYLDHDHDDRYHTRSEADAKFAEASAVYSRPEVDALLAPATVIEYYSVPAWEFEARYSDTSTRPFPTNQFDGKTFENGVGGDSLLYAPVHLPDGATIRSVTFGYFDTAAIDLDLRLVRQTGSVDTRLAETTTVGSASGRRVATDSSITEPVVDNSTHAYLLTASRAGWASSATAESTAIGDVVIEYSIER